MRAACALVLAAVVVASSCSANSTIAADAPVEPTPVQSPVPSSANDIAPTTDPGTSTSQAALPDASTPVSTSVQPVEIREPQQHDNAVLDLMARIAPPADGEGFVGSAINYQGIFAEAGVDRSTLCADKIAYREALIDASLGQMTAASAFFNPYSDEPFFDIDDIQRAFGFSFCDINATVIARLPTIAVHATVDPSAVVAAAEADERWSDLLQVSEEPDLTILDWSHDRVAGFGRPASAMFLNGFGGTLGISGDILIRTSDPERLQETVDPSTPSLLETGSVGATVEAIVAAGSHQFHFSNQPYRQNGLALLDPREVFDDEGLSEDAQEALARSQFGLPVWTSLAVGIARDAERQVGLVVMSHLSDADAADSAARFEAIIVAGIDHAGNSWSDSYQLRAIRSDGPLMIAELEIADQSNPLFSLAQPLFTRGSLYAVGDDPVGE